MAGKKHLTYEIDFKANLESLIKVKNSLAQLQSVKESDYARIQGKDKIDEGMRRRLINIKDTASDVEDALKKAFNVDLGSVNVSKFNQELKKIGLNKIYSDFSELGSQGKAAFRDLTKEALTTNMRLKESTSLLDKMGESFGNTIKWGISSSVMNSMVGSLEKAYYYVKDLDKSLNDIQIVTDKSASDMDRFAEKANQAAKGLAASTRDYTEASLIYYQQGLSDAETQARTETTLKAANVTGQKSEEVSEQLTAVWNGYKVSAQETELYVDKLAAVAASTASDLEELSTGMSKVASAANSMGVDVDQLNGMLSTVISVTRQAPESAGTAFKTIFARMGDLELNGEDEFGVSLGKVSESLHNVGIEILDNQGNLRNLGTVIEEVGEKWNTGYWSKAEKQALAIDLAGKRQYNNLLALFDNWDMYTDAIDTSTNAVGTLQHQQDIYMESTEAHLQRMRTSWEDVYDSLLDTDTINEFADIFAGLGDSLANFIDLLGGGGNALQAFGGIATQVFSKQIAKGIMSMTEGARINQYNKDLIMGQLQGLDAFKKEDKANIAKNITQKVEETTSHYKFMTPEEINMMNDYVKAWAEATNEQDKYNDKIKETSEAYHKLISDKQKVEDIQESMRGETYLKDNLKNKIDEFVENVGKVKKELESIKKSDNSFSATNFLEFFEKLPKEAKENTAALSELENRINIFRKRYEKISNDPRFDELIDSLSLNYTKEHLDEILKEIIQIKQEGSNIQMNFPGEAPPEVPVDDHPLIEETRRRQKISGIVELASVATDIQFLSDSIADLVKSWKAAESGGEKFTLAFERILSMGPSAFMVFNSLRSGVMDLASSCGAATGQVTGLFSGLKFLAGTAGGPVVMGIMGAVSAIYAIVKISNEWTKMNDEVNASLMEQGKTAIEEEKNILTLRDEYNSLLKTYKETGEGKEELISVANSLADSLGEEKIIVGDLETSWDRYTKKIDENTLAKLEHNKIKIEGSTLAAKDELKDTYKESGLYRAVEVNDEELNWLKKFAEDNKIEVDTYRLEGIQNAILDFEGKSETEIYQIMSKARDEYINEFKNEVSDLSNLINKVVKESSSLYSTASEGEDILKENEAQTAIINTPFEGDSKNTSIVETYIEEIAQKLANNENGSFKGDEEGAKNYTKNLLHQSEEFSEAIDKLNVTDEIQNILKDRFKIADKEISSRFLQSQNQDELFMSTVGSMNLDNVKNYVDLEDEYNRKHRIEKLNQVSNNIGDINSVLDLIKNKKDINDLTKEELELVESLEGKYSELGDIQHRNSHEYLQALRNQREEEEKAARDKAKLVAEEAGKNASSKIESFNEKYGNGFDEEGNIKEGWGELFYINEENPLGGSAIDDIKEVQEALDELTEAQYQIKLEIDKDLKSDVDDAFGLADEMDDLKNKINQDLVYTFDEATQLINEGYGEMFTNATKNADGTIQANKEVTEQFILDKQAEFQADKESKIEQLTNQREVLVAQKNALANKLAALGEAAQAENAVDAATALEKVKNADKDYQTQVNAMNELLDSQSQGAEQTETINEELFNSLGGMYETNAENFGTAEGDATDTNLSNAQQRIRNTNAEILALQIKANQVKAAEAGVNLSQLGQQASAGSVRGKTSSSKKVKGSGNYSFEEISPENLNSFFMNDEGKQEYQNTINKVIQQTKGQLTGVENQIGSVDAGIAALQSSGHNLDNLRNHLGESKDKDKGKGGKGGKGGGGQKEKDPDHLDYLEEESDIYHDIDLEINNLEKDISKLASQEKKLFGKELIDNLQKQLDILQKQKQAAQDKLDIAKIEASRLKGLLSGQGVTFGEDGLISNYAKILQEKLNNVNALITQYNNMSAAEQEGFKGTVEQAKKDFEEFKKNIEEYEKTAFDIIPEMEQQVQEAIDSQIEKQIQQFTMKIELQLETSEAARDFNDFKKKVLEGIKEDDILGNAKAKLKDFFTYYNEKGAGVVQGLTSQIEETLDQLKQIDATGTSTVYGDNKVQAMEDLKKYLDEIMDQLESLQDLVDEINESYLDMIDEANDKFDEQLDKYKHVSELIEHNMNLIKLTLGEDAYKELGEFYDKQEKNNNKQLDFLRKEAEFWKQKMDSEEKGSEAWEKYRDNWMDATKELNDAVSSSIENLVDKYQNSINEIFDRWDKELTDDKGMDYMNEEWELINKNADMYLDKINSMYEIQKLENKYLDSINNTDSLYAQEKLNELMDDQLEKLKTKEKLTQYDVDRANALYDIALKEIALKEAQQNKSKMRLRRDAQGNYSYQYVSDEDSVAQAQQELADAQNSLYNMDKSQYQNNLEEMKNMQMEFQEKLKEIYMDHTLSVEERERREQLLSAQYGEMINGIVQENENIRLNLKDSAFSELAKMYDIDKESFNNMTLEEQDSLMGNLVEPWNSGIQSMIDKFAGEEDGFVNICKDKFLELEDATKDYQSSLDELASSADTNFEEIYQGYDKNIDQSEELIDKNDELLDQYESQLDAIRSIISEMTTLIAKYSIAESRAKAASKAAFDYWQQENERAAEEARKNAAANGGGSSSSGSSNSSNSSGGGNSSGNTGGSSGGGDGVANVGDQVIFASGIYHQGPDGSGRTGSKRRGQYVYITKIEPGAYGYHISTGNSLGNGDLGWLKKEQLSGYDTGGYTGDWNSSEGRIGLLHQKEIVLNKQDTENILSAVSIIRGMDNAITQMKNQLLSGLDFNGFKINLAKESESIDQNVHIDANFPNVSNSDEIEKAFDNLINYASQYAFENRR